MAHNKKADNQPSAEDQALHQRVYEMMELDRSKDLKVARGVPEQPVEASMAPIPTTTTPTVDTPENEPIDIFKGQPPIAELAPPQVKEVVEPEPKAESAPVKSVDLDNESTDKIVDEIMVSESDALLAAEDIAAQLKKVSPSLKPKSKLGRLFKK